MNIEEKAKAYDEALERAKELLEIGLKDTRDKRVVLSFFPELAESEDERIRKDIISYLKSSTAVSPKTWIEWLEKQGEQKSTDKVELMPTWSKEDERDFGIIYGIIYNSCNAEDASRLISWLKALKDRVFPQPKQEWNKEDEKIYQSIMDDTVQENQLDSKQIDWLKSLKDRYAWKPSDEQIEAVRIAAEIGTANNSWAMGILKSMYQDLKKLKG